MTEQDTIQNPKSKIQHLEEPPLFIVETKWGQQPVRLTAWQSDTLPTDAPITSVHFVGFLGGRVLVVRDRRGVYGFPGGRLEPGETYEEALAREVYEEANAYLKPDYTLFSIMKIEYPERLPGRTYPHEYSYMALYVGVVQSLDPIGRDPAGVITARSLFTRAECEAQLPAHDQIFLREAVTAMTAHQRQHRWLLRGFLS